MKTSLIKLLGIFLVLILESLIIAGVLFLLQRHFKTTVQADGQVITQGPLTLLPTFQGSNQIK